MKLIYFFVILITYFTFGQNVKDSIKNNSNSFEDKIKQEIENNTSPYFYQKLLNKIKSEPEKINKEDIKYLYYGQIYKQETGLSFLDNPDEEDFRKAVYQNNCKKILKFGYQNLDKNPVQLTILVPICNCQIERKIIDKNKLENRLKMILETIFSTGDGKTIETAIKIANIEDDLVLNGILEFKDGKEKLGGSKDKIYSIWDNGKEKIYYEDSWNYKYRD